MYQGGRELAEENAESFGFDPASIDILLLTHAHLDHCGRIPLLVKRGFKGEVITTAASVELARLVMLDAAGLQEEEGLAFLFISHDIGVVELFCDRIAVMYAGKIVEIGSTRAVIHDPAHPYTKGLIKALPGSLQPGSRLNQIPGMMPTLTDIPPGCAFHPRCTISDTVCRMQVPALISVDDYDRMTACHMVK